jgi:hypothetical protein
MLAISGNQVYMYLKVQTLYWFVAESLSDGKKITVT